MNPAPTHGEISNHGAGSSFQPTCSCTPSRRICEPSNALLVPFAPGAGLGLRLSVLVGSGFSIFFDARYETAWVKLKDLSAQFYGEPAGLLGVSLWL